MLFFYKKLVNRINIKEKSKSINRKKAVKIIKVQALIIYNKE